MYVVVWERLLVMELLAPSRRLGVDHLQEGGRTGRAHALGSAGVHLLKHISNTSYKVESCIDMTYLDLISSVQIHSEISVV